jgi:predicted MFS family arabinose efflux permease
MRIIGGRHYDHLPQRTLIVVALLAYGLGMGLMATAGSVVVLVAAAVSSGFSHGAIFPILTSQVVGRARTAERGSAMSIFTSIFDIALLFSAPAVGALIDGFDYRVAFTSVAAALVLGAVVYAVWDRRIVAAAAAAAV